MANQFWHQKHPVADNCDIEKFQLLFICAEGGAGKTTTAAHYAQEQRQAYTGGVFIINSRQSASVYHFLRKHIARLTNSRDDRNVVRSLQETKDDFLDHIAERGNVLLIYDSADDLEVIQDLLPSPNARVHVIVTTRCTDHRLMEEGRVIRLSSLEEDAAVGAFLGWSGKGNDMSRIDESELQAVRRIVNDVQVKGLPLAIRRIATYTKETRLKCSQVSEKLTSRKEPLQYSPQSLAELLQCSGLHHLLDVLKLDSIERAEQFVDADLRLLLQERHLTEMDKAKLKKLQERLRLDMQTPMTWDLDLEEVTRRSPDARRIINFASLLDSSAIPVDVLISALSQRREKYDREVQFQRDMALLSEGFSLISYNSCYCDEEDTCSEHALVQLSVVKQMERSGTISSHVECLARSLSTMLPQSVDAVKRNLNNSKVMSLLPHVYSVCNHVLDSKCTKQADCWHLMEVSCSFALYTHDIVTAKHLAERMLEFVRTRKANRKKESLKLSNCLINVGDVFMLMAQPKSAQLHFDEAVRVLQGKQDGKPAHILHSVALERLAQCLQDMKNFGEAEQLYVEALDIRRRCGGSDRDISLAMNNLALLYQSSGRMEKAVELYKESLKLKRKCGNVSPLDMSTTVMNLGNCYRECGELKESVSLLKEAVATRRSCYSSPHPNVAVALERLAQCLQEMENFDEAERLYVEALDIRRRCGGSDRDISIAMNNLALLYESSERMEMAVKLYEESLRLVRKCCDVSSLDKSTMVMNLGNCYRQCGELMESVLLLEEAVATRRLCYSFPHPNVAMALEQLAQCLQDMENFGEAERLYMQALDIRRSCERSDKDISIAMNNLALLYQSSQKMEKAIELYKESLKLVRKCGDVTSLDMSTTVMNLGNCYRECGELKESVRLLEEAVATKRSCYSSPNPHVAVAIHQLAFSYGLSGKMEKAIELYQESLELKRKCRNVTLQSLSTTVMNVGCCYRDSGKLQESVPLLEEAVAIRRACYSFPHKDIALAIVHLSEACILLNETDKAIELAREALDMANISIPSSHSHLSWYMNTLGKCYRSRGEYENAISWYEKSRELLTGIPSSHSRDLDLASTLYGLSCVYQSKGNIVDALKVCSEALEMEEKRLPAAHPSIATCAMRLGWYNSKAGRYEESLLQLKSALAVLQDTLPRSHHTTDCHYFLAFTFLMLKNVSQAEDHVDKCLRLRKCIFPVGHAKIIGAESLKQDINHLKKHTVE